MRVSCTSRSTTRTKPKLRKWRPTRPSRLTGQTCTANGICNPYGTFTVRHRTIAFLAALYGRSDTYIQNYIAPRTGEDFNAAKTRILSSLNPNPSDLEIHSVVTLEAYTVSRCRERYDGQCYLLDFTHWALSSEVLPALGATTSYSAVVAGDYNSAWAEWTIPRPSLRR